MSKSKPTRRSDPQWAPREPKQARTSKLRPLWEDSHSPGAETKPNLIGWYDSEKYTIYTPQFSLSPFGRAFERRFAARNRAMEASE